MGSGRSEARVMRRMDHGTRRSGDGEELESAFGVIIQRTGTERVSGAGSALERVCKALCSGRAGLMWRRCRLATGMACG